MPLPDRLSSLRCLQGQEAQSVSSYEAVNKANRGRGTGFTVQSLLPERTVGNPLALQRSRCLLGSRDLGEQESISGVCGR